MEITTQQALQTLLENGIQISINGGIENFLSSVLSTLIGVIAGGWITLAIGKRVEQEKVIKKFEIILIEYKNELEKIDRNYDKIEIRTYLDSILNLSKKLLDEIKKEFVEVDNALEELFEVVEEFQNYVKENHKNIEHSKNVEINTEEIRKKIDETVVILRKYRKNPIYCLVKRIEKMI